MLRIIGVNCEYNHLLPDSSQLKYFNFTDKYIPSEEQLTFRSPLLLPGDYIWINGSDTIPVETIFAEMLKFYFDGYGEWQDGEGSVFVENASASLWLPAFVDAFATGNNRDICAYNMLARFEELNKVEDPVDYVLQRWAVLFKPSGYSRKYWKWSASKDSAPIRLP